MRTTRRAFLACSVTFLAGQRTAEAQQQAKVHRLGYLVVSRQFAGLTPFTRRLGELGYVEGRNFILELRHADGNVDRFPMLAAELVKSNVDVMVVQGNAAVIAAKRATATIPIVMIGGIDPLAAGLATSLARPEGNVTGLLQDVGQDVLVKQLELLRELVPRNSRVAVVMGPHQTSVDTFPLLTAAARALAVTLHPVAIQTPDDVEPGFATVIRERADALLVLSNPVINARPQPVVEFAARHRIPAVYWWTGMVTRFGGLLSYGIDWADIFRRAATYVDKILKGVRAGDLPIEQPTKFELVINLKTAKALGLTIPPSLLLRADQVIE